ncbi:hypothetical protein OH77DRAFT_1075960 [Trametes cingulata]|nr:hypothetical protein OH77DRAFT_1075960 [Trametes cingulata]
MLARTLHDARKACQASARWSCTRSYTSRTLQAHSLSRLHPLCSTAARTSEPAVRRLPSRAGRHRSKARRASAVDKSSSRLPLLLHTPYNSVDREKDKALSRTVHQERVGHLHLTGESVYGMLWQGGRACRICRCETRSLSLSPLHSTRAPFQVQVRQCASGASSSFSTVATQLRIRLSAGQMPRSTQMATVAWSLQTLDRSRMPRVMGVATRNEYEEMGGEVRTSKCPSSTLRDDVHRRHRRRPPLSPLPSSSRTFSTPSLRPPGHLRSPLAALGGVAYPFPDMPLSPPSPPSRAPGAGTGCALRLSFVEFLRVSDGRADPVRAVLWRRPRPSSRCPPPPPPVLLLPSYRSPVAQWASAGLGEGIGEPSAMFRTRRRCSTCACDLCRGVLR